MTDFEDILALTPMGSYVIYREGKEMMFRYEPNTNRKNFEYQMCIMPAITHVQEMRVAGFQTTGRFKDLYIPPMYIESEAATMDVPTISDQQNRGLYITDSQLHPVPLEDTFFLHSRPELSLRVYLDFNSHTTSGTIWNTLYTDGDPFITPSFNTEGSTSSFTNNELIRIQRIWARIVENYIGFDVDITTEDPGVDALTRETGGGDMEFGVRVAIGGSTSDWRGGSFGGVAFVGSFIWDSDTPVYVFPAQLGSGNEKYVANAASHEIGHALGLNHHGRSSPSEEYYAGHGSGATGWAPIMGNPYSRNLNQWSKGEYSNANLSIQHDINTISSYVPIRTALHGLSIGTASSFPAPEDGTSYVNGIIRQSTDQNYFTFTLTESMDISLLATPNWINPTLDILLELLDSEENVLQTDNGSDVLEASILAEPLASGTYFVRVSGTGKPTPPSTGYTNYGSIGQYTLSLTKEGQPVTNKLCIFANGNFFCIGY